MFEKFVVAHDGSDGAQRAFDTAVEDTYFGQLAAQAKRRAALHDVALETTIVAGHEVRAIVDFAALGEFDPSVIGYHGHSQVCARFWGGSSQNLARMAHCSVLIVK